MTPAEELLWRSIKERVAMMGTWEGRATLFYSEDLDCWLDMDDPDPYFAEMPTVPTTTVKQELIKMGVKRFVRLPSNLKVTNFLSVCLDLNVYDGSGYPRSVPPFVPVRSS